MHGLAAFKGATSLEDTRPHMVMQIKKALISWWLHVKNSADLALASEGNAVESGPIRVGPTARAFTEILADAGCGPQTLDPEMSRQGQSRDAVIEVDGKVINAKCLSHERDPPGFEILAT